MGSTHQTIYMPHVARFVTPVPPLAAQDAIVEYLRGELARMHSLIAKVKKQVELLREYRQALITAVVTGQLQLDKESSP
jgi:type I restriction enzyme S subunit